jgi:hypothetical protein
MSFHTFLSSEPKLVSDKKIEPKLVSDKKMKMLIEKIYQAMRNLLEKENEILSDRSKFEQFTWRFFKVLGYLFDKEKYNAMPEYVTPKYVPGGPNLQKLNHQKYRTELSLEVFKEISKYYLLRGTTWQRINKRLNRNPKLLTSRQKILADAFFNTDNGMDGNKIYTQIIENKEFEHYPVEDVVVTESWCDIMLYDANKNSKSVIL